MIEIISEVILYIGGIFSVIGAIGMLRFPDFYTRSHASTMINVGGVTLALFGLLIAQAFQMSIYTWKILFIIALLLLVNPTNTYALANAAYKTGIKPKSSLATLTKQSRSRPRELGEKK